MGERSRNFFRHGELPLVLLSFIAEGPRHAYELMARLERAFGPEYEPSTGSVYPAMRVLVDEQLVVYVTEGRRRIYTVTELGRRTLTRNVDELTAIEARTGAALVRDEREAVLAHFATQVRQARGVDLPLLEKRLDELTMEVLDR